MAAIRPNVEFMMSGVRQQSLALYKYNQGQSRKKCCVTPEEQSKKKAP